MSRQHESPIVEIDTSDLDRLAAGLSGMNADDLIRPTLIGAAQEALKNVRSTTPVKTGRLKKGWKIGEIGEREAEVVDEVYYGYFVNYGHATPSGGYVPGQYFVEEAAEMTRQSIPEIAESAAKQYAEFFEDMMGGGH